MYITSALFCRRKQARISQVTFSVILYPVCSNNIPFSASLFDYSYFFNFAIKNLYIVLAKTYCFPSRTQVSSLKSKTSRSFNSNRIYSFFLTFCICIFLKNGYKKIVKKILFFLNRQIIRKYEKTWFLHNSKNKVFQFFFTKKYCTNKFVGITTQT